MSLVNWLGVAMAVLGVGAMWWHGIQQIGWQATACVWIFVIGLMAFPALVIWLITY